jgi:hypothetical protein
MKKIMHYYAEGISEPFFTEEEAIKAEEEHRKRIEYWTQNSAQAKYDKLCHDLKESLNVWEGTIATCTHDTIRIKGMVIICKDFYEKNKHNLQYY